MVGIVKGYNMSPELFKNTYIWTIQEIHLVLREKNQETPTCCDTLVCNVYNYENVFEIALERFTCPFTSFFKLLMIIECVMCVIIVHTTRPKMGLVDLKRLSTSKKVDKLKTWVTICLSVCVCECRDKLRINN